MSVQEPTRLDTVARAPDGRLILVMTEDRFYADGDAVSMARDLAAKLDAYIGLVKSGQLPQVIGQPIGPGADIELSAMDEPPPVIRQVIAGAEEVLRPDGVGVRVRVLPPQPEGRLYDLIGAALADAAPAGWQRVEATVTLIGRGLSGSLVAVVEDGTRTALPPPPGLIDGVRHLKRTLYQPGRGTFTTMEAVMVPGSLQPSFDFGEPAEGAGGFSAAEWADEARRYPRDPMPAWWPPAPEEPPAPEVAVAPQVAEAAPAVPPPAPAKRGWFGRRRR